MGLWSQGTRKAKTKMLRNLAVFTLIYMEDMELMVGRYIRNSTVHAPWHLKCSALKFVL